jgi:hypothetical protein
MINTQLKLIFVDIPKTGSTAFKWFLTRGFHNFTWQGTSNPSWLSEFCKENERFKMEATGKTYKNPTVRHEPLLSKYINVAGIEKYFIFTIVRDPFERFKSAFVETILSLKYSIPQRTVSHPNKYSHENLIDPWFINTHHPQNNYFKVISDEEAQVKLIFNQLNIIASKGGFEKTGLCNIPLHFWPQYNFTSLILPTPLNLVIIKYENLKKDFPILKEELSITTGVDVTKEELPYTDPVANGIFHAYNPDAADTIGYKFFFEHEISKQPSNDPQFAKKYPTYNDFLIKFKEDKQQIIDHWLPTLEEHRGLIEHLYAEDYRLYEYTRKS